MKDLTDFLKENEKTELSLIHLKNKGRKESEFWDRFWKKQKITQEPLKKIISQYSGVTMNDTAYLSFRDMLKINEEEEFKYWQDHWFNRNISNMSAKELRDNFRNKTFSRPSFFAFRGVLQNNNQIKLKSAAEKHEIWMLRRYKEVLYSITHVCVYQYNPEKNGTKPFWVKNDLTKIIINANGIEENGTKTNLQWRCSFIC